MAVKDNGEVLAQQAKSAGVQGDPKPTIELVTKAPPRPPDGTPCPVIPKTPPAREPWPRICGPTCAPPPPPKPKPN